MLSTLALLIKGWIVGAQIVWWGHYWSSTSKPRRAALRLVLMRMADAVIFYTDQEIDDYRARAGTSVAKQVFALNNGIETSEITLLRRPYVAGSRNRDLLFIGRLTQKAELEILLTALARPECTGVTLDVIGDGPRRSDLELRADVLGLGQRVVWHGGIIDEARIASIANECKAFIYPGGVGLSLIHGLAYGLPAIVHDDRWAHMPEIAALKAGKNGTTFPHGDAIALANVVSETLLHTDKLDRMSLAAVETTTRTFNTEDMVRRFCDALQFINKMKRCSAS
jgi:glycosyltransferase involved in cell wall biosynthesis